MRYLLISNTSFFSSFSIFHLVSRFCCSPFSILGSLYMESFLRNRTKYYYYIPVPLGCVMEYECKDVYLEVPMWNDLTTAIIGLSDDNFYGATMEWETSNHVIRFHCAFDTPFSILHPFIVSNGKRNEKIHDKIANSTFSCTTGYIAQRTCLSDCTQVRCVYQLWCKYAYEYQLGKYEMKILPTAIINEHSILSCCRCRLHIFNICEFALAIWMWIFYFHLPRLLNDNEFFIFWIRVWWPKVAPPDMEAEIVFLCLPVSFREKKSKTKIWTYAPLTMTSQIKMTVDSFYWRTIHSPIVILHILHRRPLQKTSEAWHWMKFRVDWRCKAHHFHTFSSRRIVCQLVRQPQAINRENMTKHTNTGTT